jgi:hypothetical protein
MMIGMSDTKAVAGALQTRHHPAQAVVPAEAVLHG